MAGGASCNSIALCLASAAAMLLGTFLLKNIGGDLGDLADKPLMPASNVVPSRREQLDEPDEASKQNHVVHVTPASSVATVEKDHGDASDVTPDTSSQTPHGMPASMAETASRKSYDTDFITTKTRSWLLSPRQADESDPTEGSSALSVEGSEGLIKEPDEMWKMRIVRQGIRRKVEQDILQSCPTYIERNTFDREAPCLPACKESTQRPERCTANIFWQIFYEPSFGCSLKERIGHVTDGGKWVCNPHQLQDKVANGKKCLVYTIGSYNDYHFEEAVHEEISTSCEIHSINAVPPTRSAGNRAPGFVHFHAYTVGERTPARGIPKIASELGHLDRTIDILKIDCRGCEWKTFKAWFGEGIYIRQILLRANFKEEQRGLPAIIHSFFSFLFDLGYVIFHKEIALVACGGGSCVDYSFVKMSPKFSKVALDSMHESHRSTIGASGRVSWDQSGGLIEVTDNVWNLMKERHWHRIRIQRELLHEDQCLTSTTKPSTRKFRNCLPGCISNTSICPGKIFWQIFYEPSFTCSFEKRIGAPGEGGKWVCNPHRLASEFASGNKCLVYSVGSHGQYDFETAVHDEISSSCEIHTIDMASWKWYTKVPPPSYVNYHVYKVGDPVKHPTRKSVPNIVQELGHSHRTIDIFKIDCEGCEWTTFRSWFGEGVIIRQILIELHFYPDERRGHVKLKVVHEFFEFLFSLGYVVFQKEPNILGCLGACIEYAFVKAGAAFAPNHAVLE